MTASATSSLPLIDLARFRDPAADRGRFLAELLHAAHEVGFFYVVGHGVPDEITTGILDAAEQFFALPEERRLDIENVNSPQFRGYTRVGTEHTGGAADWREQIDIGPQREVVEAKPGDPDWLRLIGPNQWPAALPGLRDSVRAWQDEVLRVSREVLRALAVALGQATRHRVVSPQPGVDRYSIPFFLGPRLDAVVEPLTLPPALAAEAIGISADPDNPLHAAFGENALVGWLRSHPRVAYKWWSDVLARRARPDHQEQEQRIDG